MNIEELKEEIDVAQSTLKDKDVSEIEKESALCNYFIDLYNKGVLSPYFLHLALKLTKVNVDDDNESAIENLRQMQKQSLGLDRLEEQWRRRAPSLSKEELNNRLSEQILSLYRSGAIDETKAATCMWCLGLEIDPHWLELDEDRRKQGFLR